MANPGGAALTIGGVVLGGLLGGRPGAAVGGLAGGLAGSFLFGRGNKQLVHDYQLANSSYGRPIPLIYGTWRLPGNVIWEDEPQAVTQQTSGTGGKGSGGGGLLGTTTQTNYQDAAFAFCQGPAKLLKVWLDGKLFYDVSSTIGEFVQQGKFTGRVYEGTEDQLPDPLIQEWVVGHVDPPQACPAYRGLCYFVVEQINLTFFGNRMPNFTALWATETSSGVVYTEMMPLANDTTFQPVSVPNNVVDLHVSVDWADDRIFALNAWDSSLRVFDIRTGQTLLMLTWAQMWAPNTPPDQAFHFDPTAPLSQITQTLASVPGGKVYISSGLNYDGAAAGPAIWTVDPNSLLVTNTVHMPVTAGADIVVMVPFQVVSGAGAFDMLACIDRYAQLLIANPLTGTHSPWIVTYWTGAFAQTNVVVGKQDTTAGTVELWVTSSDFFGTGTLYIYKITVTGNDPSAITLPAPLAVLTNADVGVASTLQLNEPNLAYDASDDTIIVTSQLDNVSFKYSATAGVVWHVAALNQAYFPNPDYQLASGTIANGSFGTFTVNSTASGAQTWTIGSQPTDRWTSPVYSYNSTQNAIVYSNTSVGSANRIWIAYLNRSTVNDVSLAFILSDLCQRAGLDPTEIDVTQVWQTVKGYAITEDNKSYGSAIADLCQIYQIDMVESDYTLKFVPRGQAAVATITQDDLGSIDASDASHFWEVKRAVEQELPLQINVRYYDPEIDYQTGASYAKRVAAPVPTVHSKRVKTIDLPIVLANAEAHGIAETWLYATWAERDTYQTMLAQKYAWLDPTDNVTVTLLDGETLTVRIEKTEMGADFAIHLDAAAEDLDVWTPSLTQGVTQGSDVSGGGQTVTQAPAMTLLQFNIPLLTDSDDLGGLQMRSYFSAAPLSAANNATTAQLYESTDSGTSYQTQASITSFPSWGWGQSEGILGDTVSKFATDYVNTLKVSLSPGSTLPASITYTELLNGGNRAIVGQEIIQFQNADHNADGTVTLSVLLRGRRGTDWATGTHVAGETVVFIEQPGDVQSLALPLTQLNIGELWKLVPAGRLIDSTTAQPFTYKGYDLKPYAPVNFIRAISGSDLVLAWTRRSRLGGDGLITDTTDTVPLAEAFEQYEVYLLANANSYATFDPTSPGTFIRKFPQGAGATGGTTTPVTTPQVTYTAAMMATDGFNPATDTLYMVVYQLSAVVGRGFPGYSAVPVPAVPVVIGPSTITLFPTTIPSAEATGLVTLGGAGVTPGPHTLTPTTIASSESAGTPVIAVAGATTLSPTTIASSEAHGTPIISVAGTIVPVPSFIPTRYRGLYYITFDGTAAVAAAIGASPFDVKVIEPTIDGGITYWTSADVTTMKNQSARPGAKVFAYMDFGEWEDFRDYSQSGSAPAGADPNLWGIGLNILRGPPNPQWPSDSPAAFWDAGWKNICFKYIEKFIALGFDGIYLDVVDSSLQENSSWTVANAPANGGAGAGTQAAAWNWELDLIEAMRTHARTINPNFMIAANGCEPLFGYNNRYINAIDVWWKEEIFYDDFASTPHDYSAIVANIQKAQAARPGMPMAAVEYIGNGTAVVQQLRTLCQTYNLGYYVADNIDLTDINMGGLTVAGPPPPLP